MRLAKPRIDPVALEDMDPEVGSMFPRGPVLNVLGTMANHPGLLKRWLVFANHVMGKSTLGAREREIAVLRVGWLCRAEYEWAQHVRIGKDCGLTDDEILRIAKGPDAGWDDRDRAVLQATDELHADHHISDATWQALSVHYDTRALMDLVFAVGQFTLVSMALNSFGVQLEEGDARFPDVSR